MKRHGNMPLQGRAYPSVSGVRIRSVASAFPDAGRWVNNSDIHILRYGPDWSSVFAAKNLRPDYITEELGYVQRYWSGEPAKAGGIHALDLMEAAAEKALRGAELPPNAIDLCIAVTVTSPRHINSMGTSLAGRLGLSCPAFEMKTGCASLIYALTLAAQQIQAGAQHVLIACGETPSKVTNTDSNLIYAVGDAGAAIIVSRGNPDQGMITAFLGADGKYSGTMGSSGILPPTREDLDAGKYFMTMGRESDGVIEMAWSQIPNVLYQQSGLTAADIDFLVPHQVNKKRFELVVSASGIPVTRSINVLHAYANCGSAGVALALQDAIQQFGILEGQRIMLVAVGGGVSYGGVIWHW